jgi:hypothetical protein
LVFMIQFGGDALADSPSPPIHELFYAGVVQSFQVYGYGDTCEGKRTTLQDGIMQELEVPSSLLKEINLQSFLRRLEGRQHAPQ